MQPLSGKIILLGVTGGIAAYKAPELARLLIRRGAEVHAVLTKHALEFVTPLTLQTLTRQPVHTELFQLVREQEIGHIALPERAHLLLIAPASADVIAKLAHGLADDLLTTMALATRAPVLLAPSMSDLMYDHPAVQANLEQVRRYGYRTVEPGVGALACGRVGPGRLPEPEEIVEEVEILLAPKDLEGERVVVTAGPTEEPLDPVRVLSNRSSGRMGYALAQVAVRRGAQVTLVSGPTELPAPRGVELRRVGTAEQMRDEVLAALNGTTILMMAAAVADFRPRTAAPRKLKKGAAQTWSVELERTPDILLDVAKRNEQQFLVGFAAETEELLENAWRKMQEKSLDLIVANDVTVPGAGFEVETNVVKLLDRDGKIESLPILDKEEVAERIWDKVAAMRRRREPG